MDATEPPTAAPGAYGPNQAYAGTPPPAYGGDRGPADPQYHGQSHPDDDDRLPARSPGARQPQAVVQSNDPAVPMERPAPLRTLNANPASTPAEDAAGGPAAPYAAGGDYAESPAAAPDAVNPALVRPSPQELAAAAVQPMVLPGLYRDGRLVMPAPLKGSHDVLVHQNMMADAEGLERIRDNDELDRLRASHQLINFPEVPGLRVNPELPPDRRCAREWTVRFVTDAAQAYYAHFHQPLQLSSAVRTVRYQLRLQRVNGNAAQVDGDGASPHLTGQAIDFGKTGMSREEIAWMRAYLLPIMETGRIDVEEEFQQACFHISVYRSYAPTRRRTVNMEAQLR